jgi:hypothetical protein
LLAIAASPAARVFRLTGEEAVKLHQELEVDIVALGRLSVARLYVMAIEVDT